MDDDLTLSLEWDLSDFSMQERKQWREDRFREWFSSDFLPAHPELDSSLSDQAFRFALRNRLIGLGVFIAERNGRPGKLRL